MAWTWTRWGEEKTCLWYFYGYMHGGRWKQLYNMVLSNPPSLMPKPLGRN
jgi:hypothetical protein